MVLFERLLETMLFSSRFLVMMAVFGSIAASGCMFLKGLQTVQKAPKLKKEPLELEETLKLANRYKLRRC